MWSFLVLLTLALILNCGHIALDFHSRCQIIKNTFAWSINFDSLMQAS